MKINTIRTTLALAMLTIAGFAFSSGAWNMQSVGQKEGASPDAKPNVIIILADDLGCGDMSLYDGWIETPNIDRMAAEGVRFTDFHSNGSVCSPTRAALMTGRYQQRAGIFLFQVK